MDTIQINGFNCCYKYETTDNPKGTLVFLNGIGNPLEGWNDYFNSFKDKYNILGYDLRGQWNSEVTEPPYTFEQFSTDLKLLLDELNIEHAHLIGTSFGGEIGIHFAIHHPDYCDSLTVIASVTEIKPVLYNQIRRWQQAAQIVYSILSKPHSEELKSEVLGYMHDAFLPDSYSDEFFSNHADVITSKRIGMQKKAPITFAKGFDYLCDMFYRLGDEEYLTPLLHKISCQSLIIAGANDIVKPPYYSMIIADNIPNAKYIELPAGHAVTVECVPELVSLMQQLFNETTK